MSKFNINYWNTDHLVLNVMERCANHVLQDIQDDEVADKLYDICSDLEGWDADFGSSDAYTYLKDAERTFGKPLVVSLENLPPKKQTPRARAAELKQLIRDCENPAQLEELYHELEQLQD